MTVFSFVLNETRDYVTAYVTPEDAKEAVSGNMLLVTDSSKALFASDISIKQCAALYNHLAERTGDTIVNKFSDRTCAINRLYTMLVTAAEGNHLTVVKDGGEYPEEETAKRGRPRKYAGMFIYPTESSITENPRRENSAGYFSMEIARAKPGQTFEEYLAAGGRSADLTWDISKGFTRVLKKARVSA